MKKEKVDEVVAETPVQCNADNTEMYDLEIEAMKTNLELRKFVLEKSKLWLNNLNAITNEEQLNIVKAVSSLIESTNVI